MKQGEELNPKAEFEVELFIHKINDEIDKNNELTGNKIISGLHQFTTAKLSLWILL